MLVVEWIRDVGLIANVWIVLLKVSLWATASWTGYEQVVPENTNGPQAHDCRYLLSKTQFVH